MPSVVKSRVVATRSFPSQSHVPCATVNPAVPCKESAAETVLRYDSNIQVGGKIAAVGQRLLEQVGKMMSKQALEALEREMNARLDSGGAA